VSFDTATWDLDRRQTWWTQYAGRVLVAELQHRVVGVAFAGPWRNKAAYADSSETTIALAPDCHSRGIGTLLLKTLLDLLADNGCHRAYAVIALPNEPSVRLHRKLGYREVGVLDEVGRKLGRYWSTLLLEKRF
jgi:phosphinothricin acetyltransferase